MIWQKTKELVTFKIPTFTAWVITRPFAYLWNIDFKSLVYLSLGFTIYGYFTNNRALTLLCGITFIVIFLRLEYQRGEWVHWYRESFKKKALQEFKDAQHEEQTK